MQRDSSRKPSRRYCRLCDGVTPNASHMRQQHEEDARVCGLNHLSVTQAEAETNHFLPAQLHPVLTSEIASRQHMRRSYLHNFVDGISLQMLVKSQRVSILQCFGDEMM